MLTTDFILLIQNTKSPYEVQEAIYRELIPTLVVFLATWKHVHGTPQEESEQDCPRSEKCHSSVPLTHTKSIPIHTTSQRGIWGYAYPIIHHVQELSSAS